MWENQKPLKLQNCILNKMKRIVLITGATSGIGEATAELLANHDFKIIACGRRAEKLEALKRKLSGITEIITLQFDVKDKQSVFSLIQALPEEWQNIDVLINSAGNAHGRANVSNDDIANWEEMIDSNVKGLLYVTKAILPQMVKRKTGHIINLSSIAGKETYAGGAVYCASKAAVESISTALRMELVEHQIKVSNIAPGAVATDFSLIRFKGDKAKADAVYAGWHPLQASDIADTILYILQAPKHVNLADVLILPSQQASCTVYSK
jgi:NADP-dependent 3-hydroxy acid dehydrogenase YdfG